MNTPRPFALLILSALMLAGSSAARADAADELERAFAKLHQTTYRKKEIWLGAAAAAGTQPAVTEYRGDRSRMVVETDVPGYGTMRQERITVGRRAAVRTIAPGITGRLNDARRSATAHSARAVLGQVAGLGVAVATGGLSNLNVLQTVSTGVGALSTAARAQVAIGHASSSFGSWQQVDEEDDDVSAPDASAVGDLRVEKTVTADGRRVRYRRGADGTRTVVTVDAATGVPVSEETIVDGQPMCRIEYFDVGAPIAIDVPDVLR